MAAPINDYSSKPDFVTSTTTSPPLRGPGEVIQPTKVDTAAQQGSTSPGDGQQVHDHDSNTGEEVSFKEQMIGAAQKTRGTVLGDHELKEHGEAILEGRTTHEQEVQDRRRDH